MFHAVPPPFSDGNILNDHQEVTFFHVRCWAGTCPSLRAEGSVSGPSGWRTGLSAESEKQRRLGLHAATLSVSLAQTHEQSTKPRSDSVQSQHHEGIKEPEVTFRAIQRTWGNQTAESGVVVLISDHLLITTTQ